jgi:hypothetical protein
MRPLLAVLLLLALATPALAGSNVHCLTYEEKSLGWLQTICDDGSRAVSTYNRLLGRWDTTVSPPPGKPPRTCTPATTGRGVEVRCR